MRPQVAVLIDLENIAYGLRRQNEEAIELDFDWIIGRARELGEVARVLAFGDYKKLPNKLVAKAAASAVTMVNCLSYSLPPNDNGKQKSKSVTDAHLIVDCLELVRTNKNIRTVLLVAGDGDYVPLVGWLARRDIRVIGMGCSEWTSHILREACANFIDYKDAAGGESDRRAPGAPIPSTTIAMQLTQALLSKNGAAA